MKEAGLKALVTGGAGFIGSHIAEALVARGVVTHVIDNLYGGFRENVPTQAQFFEMDIQDEAAADLIRAQRYDVVFHLAAQMDVRKSVADPMFDARVNVLGTLNLLEACRDGGVRKFVFASSGGTVYGEQQYFPADEAHPFRPMSPYGVAKLTAEYYLAYYYETFGLPYVALRYANVYGPRQNPHGEAGVVAIFATRMLNGEGPTINGDGLQTRDYVYVDDVVDANLRALDAELTGSFNIGAGIETTVVELFDRLNDAAGGGFERRYGLAKPGEQRRSCLSWTRAHEALGWEPQVGVAEGLARTFEWFRKRQAAK